MTRKAAEVTTERIKARTTARQNSSLLEEGRVEELARFFGGNQLEVLWRARAEVEVDLAQLLTIYGVKHPRIVAQRQLQGELSRLTKATVADIVAATELEAELLQQQEDALQHLAETSDFDVDGDHTPQ